MAHIRSKTCAIVRAAVDTGEGIVNAATATRDALQHAMPQLSEQLGQVGLSLTGGGVSDQPAFQQAQAQAQSQGGGAGGHGRQGGGQPSGSGHADDLAAAAAVRRPIQPRGLLDTYA